MLSKMETERWASSAVVVWGESRVRGDAASGKTVEGPNYEYQIGPDNKPYAVGGEVKVAVKADMSDPDKALAEAQELRQAALAPNDPSSKDIAAANTASEIENKALQAKQEKSGFSRDLDTLA